MSCFTALVEPDGRVHLAGELDIAGLDALRAALDQAFLEPTATIWINAARLSFIDSAAIAELLHYQVVAAGSRRRISLEDVSRPVADVLEFLDLRHILVEPAELTAV